MRENEGGRGGEEKRREDIPTGEEEKGKRKENE